MLKQISKQLEKYLALIIILFFIFFMGSFAFVMQKTGSGLMWQMREMRDNYDRLGIYVFNKTGELKNEIEVLTKALKCQNESILILNDSTSLIAESLNTTNYLITEHINNSDHIHDYSTGRVLRRFNRI